MEAALESAVVEDPPTHADYFGSSEHPSPKRRRPLLVAVVVVICAVAFWQCRDASQLMGPSEAMRPTETGQP